MGDLGIEAGDKGRYPPFASRLCSHFTMVSSVIYLNRQPRSATLSAPGVTSPTPICLFARAPSAGRHVGVFGEERRKELLELSRNVGEIRMKVWRTCPKNERGTCPRRAWVVQLST